jgi:hypothetical protein
MSEEKILEKKDKYLKVSITEVNGGMEYQDSVLVKIPKGECEDDILNAIWVEWRGGVDRDSEEYPEYLQDALEELEEDGGYWSDCTLIQYPCRTHDNIPKKVFDILVKYQ